MPTWITRWKYEISDTPSAEGIWALKNGGYLVRARVTDTKTKKRPDVMRSLPNAKLHEAKRIRAELMGEGRVASQRPTSSPTPFATFAASAFRKKVESGELGSAKTRERWAGTLKHLLAELGTDDVREIDTARLEEMRAKFAKSINDKTFSPRTVNGWLSILRTIMKRAKRELKLASNPALDIDFFSTKAHRTFTREKPNALTIETARLFLETMRRKYPQHYGMTLLGFITGLRPSSLRPLRRSGPTSDVLWDEGRILVRRSNSLSQEIMESTKTGKDNDLTLPAAVIVALRWHVDLLTDPPLHPKWKKPPLWWRKEMAASDLLFPARHGGLRSRSTLDKPFKDVGDAIGLAFRLTPKGMRRTFKDLARLAGVTKEASMAVSGHQTEAMHEHYQTVASEEMRTELGKISTLIAPDFQGGAKGGGE